jgi:hypothetical protein
MSRDDEHLSDEHLGDLLRLLPPAPARVVAAAIALPDELGALEPTDDDAPPDHPHDPGHAETGPPSDEALDPGPPDHDAWSGHVPEAPTDSHDAGVDPHDPWPDGADDG